MWRKKNYCKASQNFSRGVSRRESSTAGCTADIRNVMELQRVFDGSEGALVTRKDDHFDGFSFPRKLIVLQVLEEGNDEVDLRKKEGK